MFCILYAKTNIDPWAHKCYNLCQVPKQGKIIPLFLTLPTTRRSREGEKCIAILGCIWKAQLLHDKAKQIFITALQFFDALALLSLWN
jgi:hypothetical protein